jgi:hypothetical protein
VTELPITITRAAKAIRDGETLTAMRSSSSG